MVSVLLCIQTHSKGLYECIIFLTVMLTAHLDETRKSGEEVLKGFEIMKHEHKRPITLSNYPRLSLLSLDGNNTFLF